MAENMGRELGWEDEISNEGNNFVVLPEGDYEFEIIQYEKARHNGSDKLPPCYKAILHIQIKDEKGIAIIKHNLFLHEITKGLLSDFFVSIGQLKNEKGATVKMNWNAVVGARGRAKVGIRKYTNDSGKEMEFNEIKKFYEPGESKGFEAGRF